MKVLFILTVATDYREAFLNELSKYVDLTVVAQPCEIKNLFPPEKRIGYKYIEIKPYILLGYCWQPNLRRIVCSNSWDIICTTMNLRQLSTIYLFLSCRFYWNKWVWWGHILGKSDAHFIKIIKKILINNSSACLTYGKSFLIRLKKELNIDAVSFNNTEIKINEFRNGYFAEHDGVRLLFVGRYQARKKLNRLIELAISRKDVFIRLVGPGLDKIRVPVDLIKSGRVAIFGRVIGQELNRHFDWADIVANPGHVGLLIMNAARHGKGIVIDSGSDHAPEYYMAKEARQPFIPFANAIIVNDFIDKVKNNPFLLKKWAIDLQTIAKQNYTVENMANIHIKLFMDICQINK